MLGTALKVLPVTTPRGVIGRFPDPAGGGEAIPMERSFTSFRMSALPHLSSLVKDLSLNASSLGGGWNDGPNGFLTIRCSSVMVDGFKGEVLWRDGNWQEL